MKTILTYRCVCDEDFYEDDATCCNCGAPIDKSKLKPEPYADITYDGNKMVVDMNDMPGVDDRNDDSGKYEGEID